jgi:hypothetical protein
MRIRFTRDAIYETEGPGKGPRYSAGEVYDLPDNLAKRWLRREVAVVDDGAARVEAEASAPVPLPTAPAFVEAPGSQPETARPPASYHLRHAGAGRWHVVSADGQRVTEAPLSKDEATARLAELQAEAGA